MAYTTVVAGTTITASWANANVRDQVVTPFASSAARASAITAPVEGMVTYLADSDMLYTYDGSAWQRANMNNTLDSCDTTTAGDIVTGVTTTETDIPDLALGAISVVDAELYRIDVRLIAINTVATDEFTLRIRKGTATPTGTLIAEWNIHQPGHTDYYEFSSWRMWECAATESTTLYVSVIRSAGSGSISVYGQPGASNNSGAAIQRVGYTANHRLVA